MQIETDFETYNELFAQRIPRYAVKTHSGWKSRKRTLTDRVIQQHLDQQRYVAVLGKWYPEFAVLDFDNFPLSQVEDIRGELGLDDSTSMLCNSESPDSYHLLIRPTYKDKPPTINLLQTILGPYGKTRGVEIYPQQKKCIRLPFGKGQTCIDEKYLNLSSWQQQTYWFNKCDEMPLEGVKFHQQPLDLQFNGKPKIEGISVYQDGHGYLAGGLQGPSTRAEAQFCVLYYLWRSNIPINEAVRITWGWIRKHHNGYSKEYLRQPKQVLEHIQRQAWAIWDKYTRSDVYPDSTHNTYHGYIAKSDLFEIVDVTSGSLPRSRFLFHLLRYSYPRRHKVFIPVHTDKLRSWGHGQTVKKYLNELDEKGLVRRGSGYMPGVIAKKIKVDWNFKDSSQAVLYEGRSVETFDDSLKLVHKPQDYAEKLTSIGIERHTRRYQVKTVFGSTG